MAIVNFASGSTNNRTQGEAADAGNVFNGVAGGPIETLIIQLEQAGLLQLAGQTARFNNLALKINGSSGNDTYTGTDNAETISGLAGDDNLSGNGGNDTLDGGAGNDMLDGGAGNDKMTGGAGNDTYVVDSTGDQVTEAANGGTDTVKSSISYTLGANLENLILTGAEDIDGKGNAVANRITGNDGNNLLSGLAGNDVLMGAAGDDTLDGGAGNDVMFGGAGDDTYVVDSVGDKISENSNDGTDTVKSSISYKLGSNLENLTLTGSAAINGTGNALDNVITGNAKANTLTGGAGNDTLDGGAGNDTLVGGTGDDTYFVDSVGDKVTENAGEGTDTIVTGLNYALGDNFENLTLNGVNNVDGDGNDLDNVITGNDGNNVLDGGAGDDVLNGGAGDDILLGGDGDDTLDGGDGDDILSGGDGDNTYYVDAGDTIVEGSDGVDDVFSSASFTLVGGLDNLTLTGTENIDGTGNDLDNVITGNEGDNVLDGGDGDDVIDGGDGDDTFIASEGEDTLSGGKGSDTFVIGAELADDAVIDGGTEDAGTDAVVVPVYYNVGHTSISTVNSSLGTPNATDTIQFTQSGDFSNIEFSAIEQIRLAEGVSITLSSEQLDDAIGSLDLGATNPGLHFYGVAGGVEETVTVLVDYSDNTFTPAGTVVGGTPTTYLMGDFQLDDASIGDLFHDVQHVDDFNTNSTLASYARADGSNSNDIGYGSKGVDNATLRLGDDTYYGNEGNDLLIGHQGADYLDGGAGNDIFNITGFQTGVFGISSKADDGNAEWIATGAKHDVIIGGDGLDTLRITSGAVDATAGTVVLNDDNFQSMEQVEIGTTVGRLNVEDSALQLLNDHYYLKAGTTESASAKTGGVDGGSSVTPNFNNVSVDASGITDADADAATGGLTFVGNGNINTFIGTANNDTFIGNGGNDVLTGGAGSDTFQFGKVHTMTVTGAATTVQTYTDVATTLTGVDTITDFTSGVDKIVLDNDQFSAFVSTGAISAGNLVQGVGVTAAADADDYLIFNATSGALYYDADANGAGLAVQIASLTGVTTLADADFNII
jgi:Ca2+-binding RTX toxin-like protein